MKTSDEKYRESILAIMAIILILFVSSCQPDKFSLNKHEAYPIGGLIIGNLDSVDVFGRNAFRLYPGGAVAIRVTSLTQFSSDFTIELEKGTGVRFSVRTVSNNFENHPSLTLDLRKDGYIIGGFGKTNQQSDSIKLEPNSPMRLFLENDGKFIIIKTDCSLIYKNPEELPSTEYLVIESIDDSQVKFTGIEFVYVHENDALTRISESDISEPVWLKK
jgi:hypothetical protein